jgi:hypothetical protein
MTTLTWHQIETAHPIFFAPSTMRWWGSRISWKSITPHQDGFLFITSEDNYNRTQRLYSLRFANLNTIDTLEFQKFQTLTQAKTALKNRNK